MVATITQDLLKVSRNGSGSGIDENLRDEVLIRHLYGDPPVLDTMMIHTVATLLTLHTFQIDSIELAQHLGVADSLCIFVPHGNDRLDSKVCLPQRPLRTPVLALFLLLLLLDLVAHSC